MEQTSTPFEALKAAIAAIGSQSALARTCGVSQTAVWKWLQSGKKLPAEHVLNVENETKVSRHLLRPDIYPPSLTTEDADPGEDCGPAVQSARATVACDRQPKMQRSTAA